MSTNDTQAEVCSSAGLGLPPERDNAEERYCYEMLAQLRRSYERDAKPYMDRLVAIKSMRPAQSITLTLDQAREFIDARMSACPHGVPHRWPCEECGA